MSRDVSDVSNVAAVVMAAGAGRRMGHRPKSLLQRDGESLLLRQLRLLSEVGVQQIVVVLGHHASRLAPLLQDWGDARPALRLQGVINPAPDEGPGSSLRCGLVGLPADLAGVMVLLGDQPLLEVQDLQFMLDAWEQRPADIALVLPEHDGQPGHPLVLGPRARAAVMAMPEGGLRDWRRSHPQHVQALAVNHPRCTIDIDTEADLARVAAEHGILLTWP